MGLNHSFQLREKEVQHENKLELTRHLKDHFKDSDRISYKELFEVNPFRELMKITAKMSFSNTATQLTGTEWTYLKVLQKDFGGLRPKIFVELVDSTNPSTLFD